MYRSDGRRVFRNEVKKRIEARSPGIRNDGCRVFVAMVAACFEVAVAEYFGAERRNVSRQAEKRIEESGETYRGT